MPGKNDNVIADLLSGYKGGRGGKTNEASTLNKDARAKSELSTGEAKQLNKDARAKNELSARSLGSSGAQSEFSRGTSAPYSQSAKESHSGKVSDSRTFATTASSTSEALSGKGGGGSRGGAGTGKGGVSTSLGVSGQQSTSNSSEMSASIDRGASTSQKAESSTSISSSASSSNSKGTRETVSFGTSHGVGSSRGISMDQASSVTTTASSMYSSSAGQADTLSRSESVTWPAAVTGKDLDSLDSTKSSAGRMSSYSVQEEIFQVDDVTIRNRTINRDDGSVTHEREFSRVEGDVTFSRLESTTRDREGNVHSNVTESKTNARTGESRGTSSSTESRTSDSHSASAAEAARNAREFEGKTTTEGEKEVAPERQTENVERGGRQTSRGHDSEDAMSAYQEFLENYGGESVSKSGNASSSMSVGLGVAGEFMSGMAEASLGLKSSQDAELGQGSSSAESRTNGISTAAEESRSTASDMETLKNGASMSASQGVSSSYEDARSGSEFVKNGASPSGVDYADTLGRGGADTRAHGRELTQEELQGTGASFDKSQASLSMSVSHGIGMSGEASRSTSFDSNNQTERAGESVQHGAATSREDSSHMESAASQRTLDYVSAYGIPVDGLATLRAALGPEAIGYTNVELLEKAGAEAVAEMREKGYPAEKVAAVQELSGDFGKAAGVPDFVLSKLDSLELLKALEAPENAAGMVYADRASGKSLAMGVMETEDFAKNPNLVGAPVQEIKEALGSLEQSLSQQPPEMEESKHAAETAQMQMAM